MRRKPKTKEAEVQTEDMDGPMERRVKTTQVALKAREVEKLKEELSGATTLADLGKTLEKRWPEETFLRTRVRRENPSKAMDSARAAVVVDATKKGEGGRMWKACTADPQLRGRNPPDDKRSVQGRTLSGTVEGGKIDPYPKKGDGRRGKS
jgi:hypothetical protein